VSGGPAVRHLAGARVVLLGLFLVFAALAYVFFRPGSATRLMSLTGLGRMGWAQEQFETVQAAVHVYRERMGAVWAAFAASLALQAFVVLYYYAIAHALRTALPLSACFLMVPLCTLLQAVPISFNGWGLREGLFALYFAQIGLSRDSALAFSLVGAGLIVLLSLSGAVVWASRTSPQPDPASA
jgi:glycosyltransferase 2 family protein